MVYSQTSEILRKQQLEFIKEIESKVDLNKEDTVLVAQKSELSRLYSSINLDDKALELANKALQISKKLNYSRGIGSSYASLGSVYHNIGDYQAAKKYLTRGIKELKINKQEDEMIFAYRSLGESFLKLGDTTSALNIHQESLDLSIKNNIPNREAFAHDFLGHIYYHQGKYEKAIYHFENSLAIFKDLDVAHRIALSAGNIGLSYVSLNNKKEAIQYLILASENYKLENNENGYLWMNALISEIYKEIGEYSSALKYNADNYKVYYDNNNSVGLAETFVQKGKILMREDKLDKAEMYFGKAYKIYKEKEVDLGQAEALTSLGILYYHRKEYDKSLEYLNSGRTFSIKSSNKMLASRANTFHGAILIKRGELEAGKALLNGSLSFYESANTTRYLSFIYQNLMVADSTKGDYLSALENYKQYFHYYKLESLDKTDTERIAAQYEFEKERAIAELTIKNKDLQRNIAIGGSVFLLMLIIILVYFFRMRHKKLRVEKENVELQKNEALRVKELEQFKSRFLTNITHEFRTPLTLIKGHIEVIRESDNKVRVAQLEEIENSSNRLLQLIDQLINLSKMESGNYKFKYRKGDILKTIQSSVQAFHSLGKQMNIALIYEEDETIDSNFDTSEYVYSSEAVMTILSNLISNAFKFTPEGGEIKITISSSQSTTLSVKISDTGIGIPKEEMDAIFDRFHQVDMRLKRGYEGSGIGLSLVKELVTLQNGEIYVDSNEKGTSFTIHLNSVSNEIATDMKEAEVYRPITQLKRDEELIIDSDKPIILVVEDQPELRRFIVDNIEGENQFLEAANGKEGIELAEKYLPDLIISDIMMPDTDGLELCEKLKNTLATSHIPIILLTAKHAQEDKLEGLEYGADDYIVKPFSITELRYRVRNMLRTRELFRNKFKDLSVISTEVKEAEFNSREKEFIDNLERIISENIQNDQFSVPMLAEELFLSSSQLTRKLKALTDKTPASYIKNMKLEKAKELLLDGFNVSEASYEIGYDDPVYFSKVFKKHFGKAPSHFKK